MHTLALVNQKGGCGKTTTAVNLAGALAAAGERVLVVDLDPQAHGTLALGCAPEDGPTVGDVLGGSATAADAIRNAPGGLSLLPAVSDLAAFEEEAERMLRPERRLREALVEVASQFDYAVLDCPPRADGVLAANALRAADTALLVVESGAFALQGALKALVVFENMPFAPLQLEGDDGDSDGGGEQVNDRGDRGPLTVRVVGTLFDRRTRLDRELLIAMQCRFGERLFNTVIRNSVRLREAAACGLPVSVMAPRSPAAEDFVNLATEVQEHARGLLQPMPRRQPVLVQGVPGIQAQPSARPRATTPAPPLGAPTQPPLA